jgi:hypothetical protein
MTHHRLKRDRSCLNLCLSVCSHSWRSEGPRWLAIIDPSDISTIEPFAQSGGDLKSTKLRKRGTQADTRNRRLQSILSQARSSSDLLVRDHLSFADKRLVGLKIIHTPITKGKFIHTSRIRVQHSACSVVYDHIAAGVLPCVLGLKNETYIPGHDKLVSRKDRRHKEPTGLTKTPVEWFNIIQNHERRTDLSPIWVNKSFEHIDFWS